MAGKPRASNDTIKVPKRNFVQQQAEAYGYERQLDETGQPMLIKRGDKTSGFPSLYESPKRRAKVIVGSVRG